MTVELDGHEAHASRKQRQYDAQKDRWLERQGFRDGALDGHGRRQMPANHA